MGEIVYLIIIVLYAVGYVASWRRMLWIAINWFGTDMYYLMDRYNEPLTLFRNGRKMWGREWPEVGTYDSTEVYGFSYIRFRRHEFNPTPFNWFWAAVVAIFMAIPWPAIVFVRWAYFHRDGLNHLERLAKPPANERAKLLQKRIEQLEKEILNG